jgi:hypothetical protein
MVKTLLFSILFLIHPVHVTFTSIEYVPEIGSFKVFVRMHYDDFIMDYRNSINDDQSFDPSGKIDTAIIEVRKYFNNKVQIFADDKKLDGRLISIKSTDSELTMNYLIYNTGKTRVFKVKNRILTQLYKDQANLLIFKYENIEEGVKLTSDLTEQTFNIKQFQE